MSEATTSVIHESDGSDESPTTTKTTTTAGAADESTVVDVAVSADDRPPTTTTKDDAETPASIDAATQDDDDDDDAPDTERSEGAGNGDEATKAEDDDDDDDDENTTTEDAANVAVSDDGADASPDVATTNDVVGPDAPDATADDRRRSEEKGDAPDAATNAEETNGRPEGEDSARVDVVASRPSIDVDVASTDETPTPEKNESPLVDVATKTTDDDDETKDDAPRPNDDDPTSTTVEGSEEESGSAPDRSSSVDDDETPPPDPSSSTTIVEQDGPETPTSVAENTSVADKAKSPPADARSGRRFAKRPESGTRRASKEDDAEPTSADVRPRVAVGSSASTVTAERRKWLESGDPFKPKKVPHVDFRSEIAGGEIAQGKATIEDRKKWLEEVPFQTKRVEHVDFRSDIAKGGESAVSERKKWLERVPFETKTVEHVDFRSDLAKAELSITDKKRLWEGEAQRSKGETSRSDEDDAEATNGPATADRQTKVFKAKDSRHRHPWGSPKDQRIVTTSFGRGLLLRTCPNDNFEVKLDWGALLYLAREPPSVPPAVGDDVVCAYGRGTVTEVVERPVRRYVVALTSWRLSGRSVVRCHLSPSSLAVVRKRRLVEMDAYERVARAREIKAESNPLFAAGETERALAGYARAVDAVRYVNHDAHSSNELRADLVEVMVTCSNNAATCCVRLRRWPEAGRHARNALVILDALHAKRGKKIHGVLTRGGVSDARLFGEWRGKSLLIAAKASTNQGDHDEALERARAARRCVDEFSNDEDAPASLAALEKEVRRTIALCAKRKKAADDKERRRARAMFGDSTKTRGSSSSSPPQSTDATKTTTSSRDPRKEMAKAVKEEDEEEKKESLPRPPPKSVLRRKSSDEPGSPGSKSVRWNVEELGEEEEEEQPWYKEHKEALLVAGIGGLMAAAFAVLRPRK